MVKIAYGAGHGINTPGKRTPSDEREWTFNNQMAIGFANEMMKYKNVELLRLDDPTGKTDIGLNSRTSAANRWGADYYLSFHHNAKVGDKYYADVTGTETWINKLDGGKANQIANVLNPVLSNSYGLKDRGVKAANGKLAELRDTNMPAILFEGGFMDSSIDVVKMRDFKLLRKVGADIADRLARYLGLTLKAGATENKPVEDTEEELTLNETGRIAVRSLLKKAVKKGDISASAHTDAKISGYSDRELISYAFAVINKNY